MYVPHNLNFTFQSPFFSYGSILTNAVRSQQMPTASEKENKLCVASKNKLGVIIRHQIIPFFFSSFSSFRMTISVPFSGYNKAGQLKAFITHVLEQKEQWDEATSDPFQLAMNSSYAWCETEAVTDSLWAPVITVTSILWKDFS